MTQGRARMGFEDGEIDRLRGACGELRLAAISSDERERLLRIARRSIDHREDAEDAVHTAIVCALEVDAANVELHNLRGWLTTVVRRTAIGVARKRRRWPNVDADSLPLAACAAEPAPAWLDMNAARLEAALADCDSVLQTTFALWFSAGLPYKEIARRLDVPLATVGTRLHRARQHLRAWHAAQEVAGGSSKTSEP